ncbi:2-keto-4-pentenoate hydratase/2-oxohepta-3-ene-1,7-dioic acid hydratase (catechol pathway) [Caldanaerovirga acetigignens]|uniref:2-keto-4-pentenoate hydratase/2-oxohepta-3-ene-1,7-dioic acid hydratase (Catechol pathway) n=1 Tax=Caldanaerovirga acetigignens TaxID=447595 RepID=A0A1M7GK20_9FIRM|nr:fumarylacetoacetate hydrolase family protein [Caldanaerovirga acetigignens]SHM16219.1 2-keto-4-pentenoate hydratase/2-oxohepta-3-ene-1,7-dioic acid hydratase (catechol pathway) [Caldanaerovirga acetigignens]
MIKFVRFDAGAGAAYGIMEDDRIVEVKGNLFENWEKGEKEYALKDVRLLAPCEPTKVVGVGTNYKEVVAKKGELLPQEPVIFLKPSTSVIGPEQEIIIPKGVNEVNFEAELAVVIKKKAKDISPEEATEYILGYTCGNDITVKDFMEKGKPWTKAKCFDTFMPLGPCIVAGIDGANLAIRMYHNGNLVQDSNTSDMIFNVPLLISYISKIMTLNPGDVISTGTPPGKGVLKPGDVVEVEIENIGRLRNYAL